MTTQPTGHPKDWPPEDVIKCLKTLLERKKARIKSLELQNSDLRRSMESRERLIGNLQSQLRVAWGKS